MEADLPNRARRWRLRASSLLGVLGLALLVIWSRVSSGDRSSALPETASYGWYTGSGDVHLVVRGQHLLRWCLASRPGEPLALGTDINLVLARGRLLYWSGGDRRLCLMTGDRTVWSPALPLPQVFMLMAVVALPDGAIVVVQAVGPRGPHGNLTGNQILLVLDRDLRLKRQLEAPAVAADPSGGSVLLQDHGGAWVRFGGGAALPGGPPPTHIELLRFRERDDLLVAMPPTRDVLWIGPPKVPEWRRLAPCDKRWCIDRTLDLVWTSFELPLGRGSVLLARDLRGRKVFRQRVSGARVWPLGSLSEQEVQALLALPKSAGAGRSAAGIPQPPERSHDPVRLR